MKYSINDFLNGTKKIAQSTFGKKDEYTLKFNHEENGYWYIDFPDWPFSHGNLMMVDGADDLCAFLSDDDKSVTVNVIPSKKDETHEGYFQLVQKTSGLTSGSTYAVIGLEGFTKDIWICPVTLFVLGEYPRYIYVKKAEQES